VGLRWIDLTILLAYLATLMIIGLRFSRRQNTTETYFVAKRSIPAWMMGLSLLATLISSVTFIAYPGAAYSGNWSLLVPGFMAVISLVLVGAVLIPFYRHVVQMSAYEYFGKRFDYGIRVYGSIMFALGHFTKMGFVVYLLALTVSSMTGWTTDYVIVALGAITIFYTLIGGMEAIIWADVVQGIILWIGALVCIVILLLLNPGGTTGAFHLITSQGKMSLGSPALNLRQPTILVLALYGFFFYLQKYSADQTVVQRYLVGKSDRDALKGIALGASLCVPAWAIFMLIGSLLWAFYKQTGEALPAFITKGDQVFPHFISTHIPAGVAGVFLSALLGAAMANLSSDFNSLSAICVEDYYRRLHPNSSDQRRLRMGKAFVGCIGTCCVIVALTLAHSKGGALSLWYTLSAIVAGGLAGLFLLGFLSARTNRSGAWTGIVASLLFTVWATLTVNGGKLLNLGHWNYPWHDYTIGVVGHLLLLGTGWLASLPFATMPDADRLTFWGWLRQSRNRRPVELASSPAIR
jgi:SSS family solute:Na+ symporter